MYMFWWYLTYLILCAVTINIGYYMVYKGKKVAEKYRKRTAKWNELSDEEQKRNAIKFAEEYMREVQPLDEPLRDTRKHYYNAKER